VRHSSTQIGTANPSLAHQAEDDAEAGGFERDLQSQPHSGIGLLSSAGLSQQKARTPRDVRRRGEDARSL
jgi:hypothetical protein